MVEVLEILIPITLFIGFFVFLSIFAWFRFRGKKEMQETIRAAIDKGQELSPELIEQLSGPKPRPDRDLRRGVTAVAVAVGLALFGIVVGEEDAVRPMLGVAMLPLTIGIGFLLMHRLNRVE